MSEGLKKNQDLSCLKRNVILLYELCGPKELINLASTLATLKCCEDSKSPKRLLAQVILKGNCVSGFAFRQCHAALTRCWGKDWLVACCTSKWIFQHLVGEFSIIRIAYQCFPQYAPRQDYFCLVFHTFLSFAIELPNKCCLI